MGWLLNIAYLFAALLAAPWLLYRRVVLGKRLGNWRQKLLGNLPARDAQQPCIWLHAVSVGEVVQLGPVLEQLARQLPRHSFWITTTTTTGHEVARKLYPQHSISYFPMDFTWSVARALNRITPAAIILVELELWPNFVTEAVRRQIPVVLINGRVSDRSYRSYRWIRPLLRRILPRLSRIAAQNQTYAQRLTDMGACREQVVVTGSIKFDRVEVSRDNPKTREIGQSFGLSGEETVLLVGSTQAPEEEFALVAFRQLQTEFPGLRLMLVPRHRERFEEVAAMVTRHGFSLQRRSAAVETITSGKMTPNIPPGGGTTNSPVLLLDTLGELSAAWGLADIAFVGGSLTKRGGQNMIEPAGYGAAVLFGPHTHNFKDVVALLLDADAARVIPGPEDFLPTVRDLLTHPDTSHAMGQRAQQLVASQRGATSRTVDLIIAALPRASDANSAVRARAA